MFLLLHLLSSLNKEQLAGNIEDRQESIQYNNLNIYVPSADIYSHTLYLVQAESLPEPLALRDDVGCILLSPDKKEKAHHGPGDAKCEWVSWDEPMNLINLFNKMQNMITLDENANEFQQFLFSSLASNQSIESFVNQASCLVRNPIIVLDAAYRLIAIASYGYEVDDPFWNDIKSNGMLSTESMHRLKEYGITDMIEFSKGPAYLDKKYQVTVPRLGRKLYSPQGEFLGTIAIYQCAHPLTQEDYVCIDKLGATLSVKLRYQPYLTEKEKHFTTAFRMHLTGETPQELPPEARKAYDEISNYSHMRICYLNLALDPATTRQGEYYRSYLFADLPTAFSMRYHKYIIALLGAKSLEDLSSILDQIKSRLEKATLSIGASRSFNNLEDSMNMFLEAKQALERGERYIVDSKFILHEDISLFLLLESVNQAVLKDYYSTTAHSLLREYDQKKGTDFCKTMVQFCLEGGNNVRSAQKLFIHKNSLIYRLNKISALTNLDPSLVSTQHNFYFSDVVFRYLSIIAP